MSRTGARQLGAADCDSPQLRRLVGAIDDDEAQDDRASCPPPRRRMHEEGIAHQIPRKAPDHLQGIVVGAHFDVPRIRATGAGQFGDRALESKHEDLGLDWTLGVEGAQALGWRQAGRAIASTCSRVTCMLWASRPCFCTTGIRVSSEPRASKPQSHLTNNSAAPVCSAMPDALLCRKG